MGFNNFYLTNKGANLLAKSQAGVVINFTKVGIGKGDLPVGTQIPAVTALFDKVKDLNIASITTSSQQAQIGFQFVNTGIATAFLWKELGLYATDPDEGEILYAYAHSGENADLIPAQAQSAIEFLFNMIVKISNTTQVTATIDNSLIFALKGDITYTGNTEPVNKPAGMWWYNPDTDELKFRTATTWIQGGGAKLVKSATEPVDGLKDGLLWYNTTKDEVKIYITGVGFKSLGSVTIMQFESTYIAPNDGIDTVPINIAGYTSGQVLLVDQDGVTLAKGSQYNMNQDSTAITLLGYTLLTGESIHFTNLRAIATEEIQAAVDLVQSHIGSTSNPHGVTAAQVGAYTKAEVDAKESAINSAIGQRVNKSGDTMTGDLFAPNIRSLKPALSGVDLDTIVQAGIHHLGTNCTNMPLSGYNGWLEVIPHISGATTHILQEATMWVDAQNIMRRFQRVKLNGIWKTWKEISWAIAPTETVITSGFAAGWSGQIKYGKTQENLLFLEFTQLLRNTIIGTTIEVVYTLPAGSRPAATQKGHVVGLDSGGNIIIGSLIEVIIATNGNISVVSVGSVTSNVRILNGIQLIMR